MRSCPVLVLSTVVLLVLSPSPAAAYTPQLTPELVRAAQTYYKRIPADFLPYPSEWAQALPNNQGVVMVVTPFIRLCMGLAADEFIAHYDHTEAEFLNPIIVERLNLFFADTLLLYVELPHSTIEPLPARPDVTLETPSGKTLEPRSVTLDPRPRETRGGGYTSRFQVRFALSDGIRPTDTIRVAVRQRGRSLGTLTFDLTTMR